jgi:4a-hydroxytetrahydrobiopterin dehydratase
MQYTTVTADEFATLDGVDDWRVVQNVAYADYRLPTFLAAAEFAVSVAEVAESAQHHPDIDIRYPRLVRIALTTHATGGLTTLDVDVARTIAGLARAAGGVSEPGAARP